MFNARYSLRGNRITKNKSDAAVHHIMEFVYCFDALPVSTGNLLYSTFRSHRKGRANPIDFRIPIALDAHEK
jgi:hypothetical protein